jgi:acetyl-CoA C-acetyltransferase
MIDNLHTVVIIAGKRTPMTALQGKMASLSAPQLGANAITATMTSAALDASEIDEVIMGNVLSAGVGQAPARQAALAAGIPLSTPCTTISKVCGSGMRSVMMACDQLRIGQSNAIIAGGMESMTNAPYFISKARQGLRLGHAEIKDHMFYDGLEDAYTGKAMGSFAQETADKFGITRTAMDQFALLSLQRAQFAINEGAFSDEISPVTIHSRHGEELINEDEQPGKASPVKIPTLKPAFAKDGTITAANASSISDGAAALLLTTAAYATEKGIQPLAKVVGYTETARDPSEFTLAPVNAISKLLNQIGWTIEDVDLWEINEAFAMVTMLAIDQLGLSIDKVNVNGGACALGHPIGASGSRIIVTLLHALRQRGLKRGVASLCIGGGEATAIAIEVCD